MSQEKARESLREYLCLRGNSGVYLEPTTQNPGEHEILIARGKRFVYEGFGKLQGGSPIAYLRPRYDYSHEKRPIHVHAG